MIDGSSNYGFFELPHPADVAIRIWGDSLLHFYIAALDGLYHLSAIEIDTNSPVINMNLNIASEKIEITLIDFLNEVIFMLEQGKAFFIYYIMSNQDGTRFFGEQKSISKITHSVKAATFSELEVRKIGDHIEADVVHDV